MNSEELDPAIIQRLLVQSSAKVLKFKYSLRKNKKKIWPCCFPNCHEKANNSHLLQRNGILNRIAEGGHVTSLVEVPSSSMSMRFKFDKVGLNNVMAYPVFCNNHDTEIFRSIEENSLNIMQKWGNLLLAYRATASERRKKEIRYKVLEIINETYLNDLDGAPDWLSKEFDREFSMTMTGIMGNMKDEHKLGQFLNRNTSLDDFECYFYSLSNIPICSTAIFSFVEEISENKYSSCPIFFNIVPYENLTFCSFGWYKEDSNVLENFIEYLLNQDDSSIYKFISDILCTKVENWVVNPSFYDTYLKTHEYDILKYFSSNFLYKKFDSKIDFNMFDSYLKSD